MDCPVITGSCQSSCEAQIIIKKNSFKVCLDKVEFAIFKTLTTAEANMNLVCTELGREASNNCDLQKEQNLSLEKITQKIWTEVSEFNKNTNGLHWNDPILSITVQYAGNRQHSFKAYIFDESTIGSKSYVLALVDQVKDDFFEKTMDSTLNVNLKDYLAPGNTFKVIQLVWDNSATKLGETTYFNRL